MVFRFKPVKKADIPKYFGDSFAAKCFWEIEGHAGYKRLLSIVQKLEQRGFSRTNAIDFVNRRGANFVEKALKLRELPIDLATEVSLRFGNNELERAKRLAKQKNQPLERVLHLAMRVGKKIKENPSNELFRWIHGWYKKRTITAPNLLEPIPPSLLFLPTKTNYISVSKPFVEGFGTRRTVNLTLKLEAGVYEAPLNIHVCRGKELIGIVGLYFDKENTKKIITLPVIQGIKGIKDETWPITAIENIAEFAKNTGFNEIRIIRPEKSAFTQHSPDPQRTNRFYYTIARKLKLKKTTDFFYKKLN